MKMWEFENGKVYRSTEMKLLYKKENEQIMFMYHGSWVRSVILVNNALKLEFEEVKREIDWSKVPILTKVQVRDTYESEWKNRYFCNANFTGEYYPYLVSTKKEDDSFTGLKIINHATWYRFCRIHESVEMKEEWYKRIL